MKTWKTWSLCAAFVIWILLPIQFTVNIEELLWDQILSKMPYNNRETRSNLTDICTAYLWRRFPGQRFYHVFHDMEAIMMSIANLQHTRSTSIANCKDITMIVSNKTGFNYNRSVYKPLFTFQEVSHKQYLSIPNSTYNCGWHFSGIYFNNKDYVKSHFQQYIIRKLSLKIPINSTDILIIDRKNTRQIKNGYELQLSLGKLYPNRSVRLVYFEHLTLREQYQLVMNASVIITPHGAAETAFIMVNNKWNNNVKIIELCPPYAHCGFADNRVCPKLYKQHYDGLFFVGIASEAPQWNCPTIAEHVRNSSEYINMLGLVKHVPEMNVCIDCVLSVVNGSRKDDRLIIDQTVMDADEKRYFKLPYDEKQ